MSAPRRNSGDINILAMLDGQTARPLARRLRALRLRLRPALWYGAGAVLAGALVGTLVWLASAAGTPRAGQRTMAAARPAPVPAAPAAAPPVQEVLLAAADAQAPAGPPAPASQPLAAPAPAPSRPAPHPPSHPAPRVAPAPTPHARRAAPAPKAKAVAPAVDTDVALISAIIQHAASRPSTEGNEAPDATPPQR